MKMIRITMWTIYCRVVKVECCLDSSNYILHGGLFEFLGVFECIKTLK